ncbi:heat shock 70 kDa protein 12A-like [Saccostrea cucullata]|uniref:heat shock 70 kDa protein 12A-like n=1 Tax=Saccostrea cuccullata TaxID=36930 RepID=UPI002ED5C4B6
MAETDYDSYSVVASIDIDTTRSSYAFGFTYNLKKDQSDIYIPSWRQHGTMSNMTSTTVLLNKKREFVDFGYEAEDRYERLAEEEKKEDYYYFHRFKMLLNDKIRTTTLTLSTTIPDIHGKELPAVEVFSHAIKFLKNHLLGNIFKDLEQRNSIATDKDIFWVVTVPAISDNNAKQFLRKAAEQAGIDKDKLRIALEPEAASIWCKHLPVAKLKESNNRIDSFQVDSKYLVLDAGGGTIDITTPEVKDGGKLRELTRASGGDWGGVSVDKAFEVVLTEVVGEGLMKEFRRTYTADYFELFRDFEIKKRKRNESKKDEAFVTLKIPLSLVELCGNMAGMIACTKYKGNIDLELDKLRINRATFEDLFRTTCDRVVDHVKKLLQSPKAKGVDFILMVGGFSESPVLQDEIKSAFCSKYRVIVPQEAGLTVLRGAVLFGKDPSTIDCRIAQRTYGIASTRTFDHKIHKESKKFQVNKVDRCDDLFSRHVKKDDELILNVAQAEKSYTPLKADQESMHISLYKSEVDNPMYIDDPGCTYLGSFDVPMRDTTGGLDREVKVRLLFGDTEIEVKCLVVRTGKETSYQFKFLEDEP